MCVNHAHYARDHTGNTDGKCTPNCTPGVQGGALGTLPHRAPSRVLVAVASLSLGLAGTGDAAAELVAAEVAYSCV